MLRCKGKWVINANFLLRSRQKLRKALASQRRLDQPRRADSEETLEVPAFDEMRTELEDESDSNVSCSIVHVALHPSLFWTDRQPDTSEMEPCHHSELDLNVDVASLQARSEARPVLRRSFATDFD